MVFWITWNRLKRTKCPFLKPRIDHIIDEKGLHPTVAALKEAPDPTPKKATELHSFLGIVNYYSKFLQIWNHSIASFAKTRNGCGLQHKMPLSS